MNDFKESKETFVSREKGIFNNNACDSSSHIISSPVPRTGGDSSR